MEKSIGTKGKHLRLLEEGEAAILWQTGHSEKYTDGLYCGPMSPRLGHVFTGVQGGWELVCGDWRTGPERELLLSVGRWTEGTEGRKSTAGSACGGRPDCHGSRAQCWVTRSGRSHYCNLSVPTHRRLPMTIKEAHSELALVHQLPSNKNSPLKAGPHVPAAGK